jgi:hypothetical protein
MAPGVWRMTVEGEGTSARYCFRIDLEAVEPYNVRGFDDLFKLDTPAGVRKTACA